MNKGLGDGVTDGRLGSTWREQQVKDVKRVDDTLVPIGTIPTFEPSHFVVVDLISHNIAVWYLMLHAFDVVDAPRALYIYGRNMATEYVLCECNSSRCHKCQQRSLQWCRSLYIVH